MTSIVDMMDEPASRRTRVNAWAKDWIGLIILAAAVGMPALNWIGGKFDGPGVAIAKEHAERVHNDSMVAKRFDTVHVEIGLVREDLRIHLDTVAVRRIEAEFKDRVFYGFMCDALPYQRKHDYGLLDRCFKYNAKNGQ